MLCALLLVFFGGVAMLFWPVDTLIVRDKTDALVVQTAMPLGRTFETQYIHSVQLTPVEDLYFAVNGRILQWRTRVQSQGAGLTSVMLPRGRFHFDSPWLVFEGLALSVPKFFLRVGNDSIGQNCLRIGTSEWKPLYSLYRGELLQVETVRQRTYGSREPPSQLAKNVNV